MAELKPWTYVKWGCVGLSVGSVAASFLWLWLAAPALPPAQKQEVADTGTRVEKPLIVERDGERIIWRLQADKADQEAQGMHLTRPRLELFTESGKVIPVRGRQAWFQPMQRNIRFEGGVIVRYGQWQLRSEVLIYDSTRDELRIPGAFRLHGKTLRARGKGLRAKRRQERIWVENGIWMEDSSPAGWSRPS